MPAYLFIVLRHITSSHYYGSMEDQQFTVILLAVLNSYLDRVVLQLTLVSASIRAMVCTLSCPRISHQLNVPSMSSIMCVGRDSWLALDNVQLVRIGLEQICF